MNISDGIIAVDFETEDYEEDNLFGSISGLRMVMFSYAYKDGKQKKSGVGYPDDFDSFWEEIKDKTIVFHHAGFDLKVLKVVKAIDIDNVTFEDTMIMSHLLDEQRRKALKELRVSVLGKQARDKYIAIDKNNKEEFEEYARLDAEDTLDLYYVFAPMIVAEELENVYGLEKAVVLPTIEMELTGIKIDTALLLKQQRKLNVLIAMLKERLRGYAGGKEININSPIQMNWFLFEYLNITIYGIKRGVSGYFPTDENVLLILCKRGGRDKEVAETILELRGYEKLLSTYNENLLSKLKEGRLHASFKPTGTATGRYSSSNPNLQNIPAIPFDFLYKDGKMVLNDKGKPEYDPETAIRAIFYTDKCFISTDYSQIELRLMADLSQDPVMCKAYREGIDIHLQTALLLKISRPDAKPVNFGIGYGLQAVGLARNINANKKKEEEITIATAQEYIDSFWVGYAGIDLFFNKVEHFVKKHGYIRTISGRKRRFYELDKPATYREAKNTVIQGSSADMIKLAMVLIYNRVDHKYAKLVLQVHDEIMYEVEECYKEEAARIIKECMETAIVCTIPIIAEPKIIHRWSESK